MQPSVSENLFVVGLNHRTANLALRERLTFPPATLPAALARLCQGAVAEVAILSTCNRTEVYAVAQAGADVSALVTMALAEWGDVPAETLAKGSYTHAGDRAARHLFVVAASLDSMLIGEPEVLGQVKRAMQAAQAAGTTGPILNKLFQHALHVGKAVRSRTGIGQHALSLGAAAVELARRIFAPESPERVLVIGAGEIAGLVARNLTGKGFGPVIVANRTYERACQLAAELGGQAIRFDQVSAALVQADVVVCASGAPHRVLECPTVARALGKRDGRSLFLIDIAVPRDVDPQVADLPGARLYDLDGLQGICDENLRRRQREADRAMTIVEAEAAEFAAWLDARAAVPVIRALRARGETIRRAELEKAFQRLGELTPAQQRVVEGLSTGIVNKLLHAPVVHLKSPTNGMSRAAYLESARKLFDLTAVD